MLLCLVFFLRHEEKFHTYKTSSPHKAYFPLKKVDFNLEYVVQSEKNEENVREKPWHVHRPNDHDNLVEFTCTNVIVQ